MNFVLCAFHMGMTFLYQHMCMTYGPIYKNNIFIKKEEKPSGQTRPIGLDAQPGARSDPRLSGWSGPIHLLIGLLFRV